MPVRFEVKAKKTWPVQDRFLVADAVDFALQYYNIPKDDINLLVRLCGPIEDNHGMTIAMGDRYIIKVYKHPTDFEYALYTVFHEVTHLKQGYEDELDMAYDEEYGIVAYWNTTTYRGKEDYWYYYAPWEVEARYMEDVLYKLYLEEKYV